MKELSMYRVKDLALESITESSYDISFFASGYEERCTHLPRLLSKSRIGIPVILGFVELRESGQRRLNNQYFASEWTRQQVTLSTDDDTSVYQVLWQAIGRSERKIRLLVDYSSMSRLWYTAILNWARFALGPTEIEIDFVYAIGQHEEVKPPMVISDVLCLPGCEGNPTHTYSSVAVFGLGFEGLAALCVLDRLQPNEVYSYLASPAAFDDYPFRAKDANQELIDHSDATFELPMRSVERTFSHLAELISPYRKRADITFIPMGPKPHTLASILLAMRFQEIACLRVSGSRHRSEVVGSTGEFVATRVTFITKSPDRPRAIP